MAWNRISLSRAVAYQSFWKTRAGGTSGRFSSAWEDEVKRDPMLTQAVTVIEVTLAGRTLRYATAPLVIYDGTTTTGKEQVAIDGLLMEEPEIDCSYSVGEGSSSVRSFSFEAGLPLDVIWSIMLDEQRMLAGWAEVSLIVDGMAWRDRFRFMTGDIVGDVSFGSARETVGFKIADPKLTADVAVTEWVIDVDRWSDAPEEFIGRRYPLIFNAASYVEALRVTTSTTAPSFLLCYGHDISIDAVYVDGVAKLAGSLDFPWAISQTSDALGVPVTLLVFSGGTGTFEDTTSVYVDVSPDGVDLLNIVEVIEKLVREWSMLGERGIDRDAFSRARSRVVLGDAPAIVINGSDGEEATRSIEYIESTITASYPMISMAWQPGGYGPIITDRRAAPVAKWVVGQWPIFHRETGWEATGKDSLLNWFTVRYAYNALTDSYEGVVTRTPNNSLLCQVSEVGAGPRDDDPIESVLISDEDSAVWIADWKAAHQTLPSIYIEYPCAPSVILQHKLGDNVEIVEGEIPGCTWDDPIRATIEKLSYRRGKGTVGLRLWVLYANLGGGALSGESPYHGLPTQP